MPPVNGVGEPGAGEPHARFEVAGAGKGMTWPRSPGVAQPPGKPAEERPWALPSDIITSPAPDPTAPSGPVPPSELAAFKHAHEAQLRNLNSYLNNALDELAAIPNDELRENMTANVLDNIRHDVRVLHDQMSKQPWPKIILTGVGGLIVGGLAVGATVVTGGSALALGLGVAAAVSAQYPAASGMVNEVFSKRAAVSKPLAYAALVQAL